MPDVMRNFPMSNIVCMIVEIRFAGVWLFEAGSPPNRSLTLTATLLGHAGLANAQASTRRAESSDAVGWNDMSGPERLRTQLLEISYSLYEITAYSTERSDISQSFTAHVVSSAILFASVLNQVSGSTNDVAHIFDG